MPKHGFVEILKDRDSTPITKSSVDPDKSQDYNSNVPSIDLSPHNQKIQPRNNQVKKGVFEQIPISRRQNGGYGPMTEPHPRKKALTPDSISSRKPVS